MGKRPGWKVQPTIYRLKFEGDDWDGLEIEAKSMPLGEFFAMQAMEEAAARDPEAAKNILRKLSGVIVGWNLEDEAGKPIPAGFEGLMSLELSFVLRILGAWREAVASVPNLSRNDSNDGGTSPEQSFPMEVSSDSP